MNRLLLHEKTVLHVVNEFETPIRESVKELQNKSKYMLESQDSVSSLKFLLEDVDAAKENKMAVLRMDSAIEALNE